METCSSSLPSKLPRRIHARAPSEQKRRARRSPYPIDSGFRRPNKAYPRYASPFPPVPFPFGMGSIERPPWPFMRMRKTDARNEENDTPSLTTFQSVRRKTITQRKTRKKISMYVIHIYDTKKPPRLGPRHCRASINIRTAVAIMAKHPENRLRSRFGCFAANHRAPARHPCRRCTCGQRGSSTGGGVGCRCRCRRCCGGCGKPHR